MIYIPTPEGRALLVLDPQQMDRIRSGKWIITPDRKFVIAYTPDAAWVESQFNEMFLGPVDDAEKIKHVLEQSMTRKPVRREVKDA